MFWRGLLLSAWKFVSTHGCAVTLWFAATSCRSVLDLDVQYECFPIAEFPHVEEFAGDNQGPAGNNQGPADASAMGEDVLYSSKQDLVDQCWKSDNLENINDVTVEDGDLVINSGDAEWTENSQAPMFYRRVDGDFVIVARAEALDRVSADHCDPENKFAGIVLRATETEWSTVMVSPFFLPESDCADESVTPPTAQAQVQSAGWGAAPPPSADFAIANIGEDGEADIAACRVDDAVYYYYYDLTELDPEFAWKPFPGGAAGDAASGLAEHTVGSGPLDVGLTAAGKRVQGHFNRVVFQEPVGSDGCGGVLERLQLPESN